MKKIQLLIIFLLPMFIYGQRTKSQVLDFLHMNSEKLWLYKGTETVMKGSDQCDQGKYFIFRSDNKVVIGDCINGKWNLKEESYSLRQETEVDWFIKFGNQEFNLVMTEVSAYDEIKLRKFNGQSKSDPALDIILKHLKDD